MKRSIPILAATTVAFGAASFFLFYQWYGQRGQTQAQLAHVRELEMLRTRLERENQELREARTLPWGIGAAPPLKPRTAGSAMQAATAPDSKAGAAPAASLRQAMAGMMNDPALRQMMSAGRRTGIQMVYGDLFKDLKLSPAQSDRFTQILSDQQARAMDMVRDAAGDPAALAAARNSVKADTDAALQDLLGAGQFQKYEDYQKTLMERMQVNGLDRQLGAAGAPLGGDQKAQLLAMMIDEKSAVPPPAGPDGSNLEPSSPAQIQWQADYDQRVHDRASQILTPGQLKQFEQLQASQAAVRKMVGNMMSDGGLQNRAGRSTVE